MMTSVTTKGQVTVPKHVREHLGIQPGDRLNFQITKHGIVVKRHVDEERMRSVIGCFKDALPGISSGKWTEMCRGPVELPPAAKKRLRGK